MLVGVLAGPLAGDTGYGTMGDGTAAALYYVVVYGVANLGAFAVLAVLRVRGAACETLRDVAAWSAVIRGWRCSWCWRCSR